MAMKKQEAADEREVVGSNNSMDGGDRLSELPKPILQHILSFLSQRKSVRTCVLSKSWRYLWSTRPKFRLRETYFGEDKESFTYVLSNTLHCFHIQKLLLEEFHVCFSSTLDSDYVTLLKKWIPIVILNMCVNKFYLSFHPETRKFFDLPLVVFESKFLRKLFLQGCNLNNTFNSIDNNVIVLKHLKSLSLLQVYIEDQAFEKIMSICPMVELLVLDDCEGLNNIKIVNTNLKDFKFRWYDDCYEGDEKSIDIDDIATLESVSFSCFREWFHDHAFLGYLKSLHLENVLLSANEFSTCTSKYPCLEELVLDSCYGFVDFNLSSRSIRRLTFVEMEEFRAVIDAPNIVEFNFQGDMPRSISFTTTDYSTKKWESNINLWLYDDLDYDAWSWLLELHTLVMDSLCESEISLSITQYDDKENRHIEVEKNNNIGFYKPVEVELFQMMSLIGHSSSYLSGFINALFCVCRPRKIKGLWHPNAQPEDELERKQNQVTKVLCKILCTEIKMRKGQEIRSCWKQDVEDIILEVFDDEDEEWHPARGTISWFEYCSALLPKKLDNPYELRFQLKWKELM